MCVCVFNDEAAEDKSQIEHFVQHESLRTVIDGWMEEWQSRLVEMDYRDSASLLRKINKVDFFPPSMLSYLLLTHDMKVCLFVCF